MSEIKNRIKDSLDELDEDYSIVELSVNRGSVDIQVQTDVSVGDLENLIDQEFSDKTIVGLDVQKMAVEELEGLVKQINFNYRD